MLLSGLLLGIATVLFLSILFYHVSAVRIYEQDQQRKFIDTAMVLHSLNDCVWVSETEITDQVITLKCQSPVFGDRVYHLNTKYQILGQLNPGNIKVSDARRAFIAQTGITDFKVTITYYENESVYWVTSGHQEWLLDINDFTILWKVDKTYE